MRQLIALTISAPRRSLVVMLLFVAGVSTGIAWLEFDFSPQQVYGGQQDVIDFAEEHKRLFRFEDNIALVLLESTDERSLIRPDTLRWMKQLSDEAKRIPGVTEVSSLVAMQTPRFSLRQREIQWVPMIPESRFEDSDWMDRRLEKLPLLNDLLVSKDEKLTLTLVSFDPDGRDINTTRERIDGLEEVLNRHPLPEGTQIAVSGVPSIRVDVIESLQTDQFVMTPISAALFVVLAIAMYRSIRVTAVALLSVLAAVGLTLGIMGWCGMTFSILSNIVPTLVMIIGAANCVHIIGRLQGVLTATNKPMEQCIREVMREMSKTCLLTLATTGIGFGSLLMARSDLLQLLAVQSALGMLCNYVCLMLILSPGLVLTAHLLPEARSRNHGADEPAIPSTLWQHVGSFVCHHAALIVVAHLGIAAAAVVVAMNIRVNSYMFETYESGHPVVQVTETLDDRMSGLITLEVQLIADVRQRFFEADMAQACKRIRDALLQDDRISFSRDYIQVLSAFDHRVMSSDTDEATAALGRVQRILPKLQKTADQFGFLAADEPRARIMLRVRDIGSMGFKELFVHVDKVVRQELPRDVGFRLTGDAWLHAICMDQFVRDLFYSLIAASGIIFVLIGLLFRSVKTGLISAIPNLFPLTMTLGYMYLRGYELTAGNVIVYAISLGIAVDDTIHFLARYREESKRSTDEVQVVSSALASSGRAILLTSCLVVAGLSVLIFSEFLPTRRFAELTAITMCAALPGDLILLPAMLSLVARKRAT